MRVINIFNIINVIGACILLESLFFAFTLPVSVYFHEHLLMPLAMSLLVMVLVGGVMYLGSRKRKQSISRRESFYIAFWAWLIISLMGALPYIFTSTIPKWYNAFFESVSGFTTTGSSILADIEALPKSILFWRSLTHWIGGLGILVLVVAVVSFVQSGGNRLMFSEGNMIESEKLKPRITQVAHRLWFIYLGLTLLETLLLYWEGLSLFEAFCHSCSTIATGGFSTRNASIANMSGAIQYTIAIFMILAGMNFVLHYKLVKLKFREVGRNVELKYYLAVILGATLIITLAQRHASVSVEPVFRSALFQVTSILSATGFASEDYLHWLPAARFTIFMLMLIGACVGSTGGGIKIKRYVVVVEAVKRYVVSLLHPNVIQKPQVDDITISHESIQKTGSFITLYLLTIVFGTVVLMLDKLDAATALSAVTTTLAGIGPGFGKVGPMDNFMLLPVFSKLYLCFNMIVGRLEILPVLILFHPAIRKA